MNMRERIEAFWAGERPDRIPYTIYHNEWRHTQDDARWGLVAGTYRGAIMLWRVKQLTTQDTRIGEPGAAAGASNSLR